MKESIYYEIKTITPSDYELLFRLKIEAGIFKTILDATLKKMKDKRVTIEKDIKEVKEFSSRQIEVPKNYYNLVRTSIHSKFIEAKKIFAKDGIVLISDHIGEIYFKKQGAYWEIYITIVGIYSDRRK